MKALVLAAAIAAVPAIAAAQTASFDFRGVTLGMSMDEARAVDVRPYADLANATLVCTGDPQVGPISYLGVHLSEAEQAAGVRRCAYYNPERTYGTGSAFSQEAALNLGGGYAAYELDYAFDFFPDDSGTPRLYRIWFRTNAGAFDAIVAQLQAKFGVPAHARDAVQNSMGATFERRTATWRRPGAVLLVRERADRVDRMDATYSLTAVYERAAHAIEAAQGQAGHL